MVRSFAIVLLLTAALRVVTAVESDLPSLTALPKNMPSPTSNPPTAAKIALGKQLFFDPRLSGANTMSCATCHLPDKAFADGLAKSPGNDGQPLNRNTLSLANVALFDSLLWDGRASSLEEQAFDPLQSPLEMNQNLDELERELNAIDGYRRQFQDVYGTPITRDGIAKSLAAFERTLVTQPAPLDRYLAGDKQAISKAAERGFELFQTEAGCIRCHHGPLLSDGKFYRIGASWRDRGRGLVTHKAEDDYRFRTPSLRNVAQTAPYMHDGSLETLYDVVLFYFRAVPASTPQGQPLDINPRLDSSFSDIDNIVAFLHCLTGTLPEVTPPELPD